MQGHEMRQIERRDPNRVRDANVHQLTRVAELVDRGRAARPQMACSTPISG